MEKSAEFNLEKSIDLWLGDVRSDPSFTESDSEELRSHLFDIMDELKTIGLDDEEAFMIASKRLGNNVDWGQEYREANNPIVQMRRSLIIFAGVLFYFLCYYFIRSSSKLLYIFLFIEGAQEYRTAEWIGYYVAGCHFLFVLFLAGIFLIKKKTLEFIDRIKLKPKHTIYVLFTIVSFVLVDRIAHKLIRNLISHNPFAQNKLIHIYIYFDKTFPLLIGICFVLIYYNYYKKSKPKF